MASESGEERRSVWHDVCRLYAREGGSFPQHLPQRAPMTGKCGPGIGRCSLLLLVLRKYSCSYFRVDGMAAAVIWPGKALPSDAEISIPRDGARLCCAVLCPVLSSVGDRI